MKTATVPVYVLADDGRLYRDPVIEGSLFGMRWSLRFDADDPTEFLLVTPAIVPGRTVGAALSEAGVCACVRSFPRIEERYIGGRLASCAVWNVDVMAPIPAELLRGQEGAIQPRGEHVLYAFGRTWG